MTYSGAAAAACAPDVVSIKGSFGQINFDVAVAETPQDRARGLMHVRSMPARSGMLFVYPRPQRLAFWMRNTLIPLDMIFVGPTGEIAKIHTNAIPLDETPIEGGEGLTHVLEINGGLSARFGIAPGDVLRHPSFDPAVAIWPCE
ncbi:hypothetical protein C8N43_0581 [Litoreibacter ponti]|uniref:DUF192 domain-containing protein n=1 Tax=Litoreibacter ponti TaxID=1510457 RepID=A0A2T6BIN4_9RHOB|nr:hypothetical protein C8N43_0581 [Litoreibacter ponti]